MEFNATFIVAFISFIVFTFVMNLILYKPICDIVEKRKKLVNSNYEEADKNDEKKQAVLQERENKLANATEEAKSIVAEKTNEINSKKDEITSKAKAEAQKNIDAYNVYYNNATAEARDYLKKEVVNLAQTISDKLLGADEKISDDEGAEIFESIMQG